MTQQNTRKQPSRWLIRAAGLVVLFAAILSVVALAGLGQSAADEAMPTATVLAQPGVLSPEELAKVPVAHNADWTPVERNFDSVAMVLVPAGCFTMGSSDEQLAYLVDELHINPDWLDDEQPAHSQCFDTPFWIDQYEVTNEQYGEPGCTDYSSRPDQPRNCINWEDARAFCESRAARLPTEAEWEYAARGPDSLIYPWGNEFISENVMVAFPAMNDATPGALPPLPMRVGSHPGGVSWVGALDMTGNVWEWTSSRYAAYPYDAADDREDAGGGDPIQRVHRGGAYNNETYTNPIQAAVRGHDRAGTTHPYRGFRCVRDIE
ncbi:MAG: SUMF1/EgtB/PvdO family nonheme iron enzyme [Anaerolineaceae bacterium]|nr:SUMF1/EgtB/PvdO family nonheme iron enzyme [Anaerolineaceae bacterium]